MVIGGCAYFRRAFGATSSDALAVPHSEISVTLVPNRNKLVLPGHQENESGT
jgi:hypothetical protein